MLVANCRSCIDPSAGDQSGSEWRLQNWFEYSWDCVLRFPDSKIPKLISNYARHAAQNDRCGYNQSNRLSFWEELEGLSVKDPKNIIRVCDADCSSSTASIVKAVGYTVGNQALMNVSPSLVTSNMRQALLQAGFVDLTSSQILNGYGLAAGDIILNESCHVIIAVADSDFNVDTEETVETAETVETEVTEVTEVTEETQTDEVPQPDIPYSETDISDIPEATHDTSSGTINYDNIVDEPTVEQELVTHVCRPTENSWFVWAMQYLMKERKYYQVQADGIYGTLTGKALVKWQKSQGLVPDALCGQLTWESLYRGLETMIGDEGEKGFIVKALQYLLRAQGYYIGDGDADGIYGVLLYKQVVRFQESRFLEANGLVNDATWKELTREWK